MQNQWIWKIMITNHRIFWISVLAKRPWMGSWPRFEQNCFIELINNEKIRFLRFFLGIFSFSRIQISKKKLGFLDENVGNSCFRSTFLFFIRYFFENHQIWWFRKGVPLCFFVKNQCFWIWNNFGSQSEQTGHLQAHSLFVGSNEGGDLRRLLTFLGLPLGFGVAGRWLGRFFFGRPRLFLAAMMDSKTLIFDKKA